jgi:hypothetical protein
VNHCSLLRCLLRGLSLPLLPGIASRSTSSRVDRNLSIAPESGHSGRTHTGIETRSSLTRSPLNVIYSRSRSVPELVGVHLVPGNWIAGNSSCHCCLRVRRGSSSSADASSKKYRTGRGREKAVEERRREKRQSRSRSVEALALAPHALRPQTFCQTHTRHTLHTLCLLFLWSAASAVAGADFKQTAGSAVRNIVPSSLSSCV